MAVERKTGPAREGETRMGGMENPAVQGCLYVTAGTDLDATTGLRTGVANHGSFIVLDSVDANGAVLSWQLFVDSAGNLRIAGQVAKTSNTTPLVPGSVLNVIPNPDTENDGVVVGTQV